MSTDRVKQMALEKIFETVSRHAAEVPIILVATKADEFYGSQFNEAREKHEQEITNDTELMRICDMEAAEEVKKRLELIETELLDVEGGRFDDSVAVRCSPRNSASE
jgi:GTPase SAR1 family protein